MNSTKTADERQKDLIERTLQAYDRDLILSDDPFLAAKILDIRRGERRMFGIRSTRGISAAAAGIAVMILLNIATMIYIAGKEDQNEPRLDIVSQLRSEYEIDQPQFNEMR